LAQTIFNFSNMVSPLPTDILWELIVELLATPLHLEGVLNVTLRPVAAGGQQFASVQGEEAGGPHIMLGPHRDIEWVTDEKAPVKHGMHSRTPAYL